MTDETSLFSGNAYPFVDPDPCIAAAFSNAQVCYEDKGYELPLRLQFVDGEFLNCPGGSPVPENPQLVLNHDFTQGENGIDHWNQLGTHPFQTAQEDGQQYAFGERTSGTSRRQRQVVPIEANETYELSSEIRTQGGFSRVTWFVTNAGGQVLLSRVHQENSNNAWDTEKFIVTAPPDSAFIRIEIEIFSGSGDFRNISIKKELQAEESSEDLSEEFKTIVVDANDNVVIDTAGGSYRYVAYGTTRAHEWKDQYLNVVRLLETDPSDIDTEQQICECVRTIGGVLDERTCLAVPKRVTSISVRNGVTAELLKFDNRLDLAYGYNVGFSFGTAIGVANKPRQQTIPDLPNLGVTRTGGRKKTRLTLTARPGGGLGKYPGCEEPDIAIKTINGTPADEFGNVTVDAGGCYWVRQPSTPLGVNESLLVPAALQAGNDCGPCCECSDYEATYKGLVSLDKRYRETGNKFQDVRAVFRQNIDRFESYRKNRLHSKTTIVENYYEYVEVGVMYCSFGTAAIIEDPEIPNCENDIGMGVRITAETNDTAAEPIENFSFEIDEETVRIDHGDEDCGWRKIRENEENEFFNNLGYNYDVRYFIREITAYRAVKLKFRMKLDIEEEVRLVVEFGVQNFGETEVLEAEAVRESITTRNFVISPTPRDGESGSPGGDGEGS